MNDNSREKIITAFQKTSTNQISDVSHAIQMDRQFNSGVARPSTSVPEKLRPLVSYVEFYNERSPNNTSCLQVIAEAILEEHEVSVKSASEILNAGKMARLMTSISNVINPSDRSGLPGLDIPQSEGCIIQ